MRVTVRVKQISRRIAQWAKIISGKNSQIISGRKNDDVEPASPGYYGLLL